MKMVRSTTVLTCLCALSFQCGLVWQSLWTTTLYNNNNGDNYNHMIARDFLQSHGYAAQGVEERKSHHHNANETINNIQRPLRRSRTIMGILSSDTKNDLTYRKRHRELFALWKDERVCSIAEWHATQPPQCELIYVFVLGHSSDNNIPRTELVNDTAPVLAPKPIVHAKGYDVNEMDDLVVLNIRENMNEGKSQTFLYYATTLMHQYEDAIDYAMKCDADAILHLHDWFYFAHVHLPPAPYHVGIFAGALRDKAYWPKHAAIDLPRFESYWGNEYDGVHLYIAGQCYVVSQPVAEFIVQEAPISSSYQEGHEDHDITAMAWHDPTPLHLITIGRTQRFWEHPVKGEPRWRRIWKREQARMNQELFEGKMLRLY